MKPVQSKFSRPTTAKKVQKPEKAPSKTMSPTYSGQDGNISELMEQLIISQKQCEKSGKYVEAQGFKRKVKALQEQLQKRDMIEIRNKHEHERQSIQQAHLEQLNCFNIEWSEKIAQLEHAVKEMENELISKHEEQLRVVEEEIDGQKPYKFKQSAQLLNLKKIQQQLAKQQNYMQAHQVQLRAQKLQKQQFERWKQLQSTKSKTNLNILKQKQQNELNALKQRIDLMFEQKSQQKHQEQQAIMLKYQNVLKELEYQQKQEVMRFEKTIKLKGMQKKTKFGLMSASKVSLQ